MWCRILGVILSRDRDVGDRKLKAIEWISSPEKIQVPYEEERANMVPLVSLGLRD